MGWSSGSQLLSDVWGLVRQRMPTYEREEALFQLMQLFAEYDCDTVGEVVCDEWYETAPAYKRWQESREKKQYESG